MNQSSFDGFLASEIHVRVAFAVSHFYLLLFDQLMLNLIFIRIVVNEIDETIDAFDKTVSWIYLF